MSNSRPFTINDAALALYTVDANGTVLETVWIGAHAESCSFDLTYKARALQTPGRRYARSYNEDEEHTIELRNVWVHDVAPGPVARMPSGYDRDADYALVVVWAEEEEAGIYRWAKRVYRGVTSGGQKLDGDSTFQTLRFRAEYMTETSGFEITPETGVPLQPTVVGEVWYVSGTENLRLYTYDLDTKVFTPTNPALLAGRALIELDDDKFRVTIGSTVALRADVTNGLQVVSLESLGATFLDSVPRLEFYLGVSRLASLGEDGTLALASFIEQPTQPSLESASIIILVDGTWLLTLALPATYFLWLNETIPPA